MPKVKRNHDDLDLLSTASESSARSSPLSPSSPLSVTGMAQVAAAAASPASSGATSDCDDQQQQHQLDIMRNRCHHQSPPRPPSQHSSGSSSRSISRSPLTMSNEHSEQQQQPRKKLKINPFSIEAIMQQQPTSPARSSSATSSLGGCHIPNTFVTHKQHHHNSSHPQHSNNNNNNHHHQVQQQRPAAAPAAGSSSTTAAASKGNGRLSGVECTLDNKDMWDKFHSLNTEMIITKTGRRMFPVMKVQFHNLDPNARYAVSMDIIPVDNKRYRYAYHKSCWQVAGKADPSAEPRLYPHPDSPFNGDLLARQVISFEKVKLTNNEMDKSGHIILNSMHKYQPRVHLIELKIPPATTTHAHQQQQFLNNNHNHHNHKSNTYSDRSQNHHHQQQQQAPQLDIEGYRTFVFPETVFTAVTAYQNQLITKMKIDKNPFAKGFRDSSRLSDLDRNDPFDYMGPLGQTGRFGGGGTPGSMGSAGGPGGGLDCPPGMDAFQLLAASAAANNPWYSAAAMAAAAGHAGGASTPNGSSSGGGGGGAPPGSNPFGLMGVCGSAQAAQLQTQMMLAAFSAYINGGAAAAAASASAQQAAVAAAVAGTSNNQSPEDK